MKNDIKKIIYSQEMIEHKVQEMATQISTDYEGKDLLVICILKGSVIFTADLLKHISIHCNIDFMAVSSYGSGTESSGKVTIKKDIEYNMEGRNILIVEDIVDSGLTLKYLVDYLKSRKANSVEVATLMNKPSRRKVDIYVRYSGFEVPNEFLVGYGLDYDEKYRNLPFVGVLKPEIYEK